MLTAINKDNKNRYLSLFEKAFTALKEAGKLTAEEETAGAFTSLEQYFTRIGDLYAMNRKDCVLLLPLDEPMFEINANTREIVIPAHFKKHGISVEGDQIAETLIFKINRFIDFIDLNETDIFVQWEIEGKEEYSNITFKYLDYDPEFLLFTWPITNRITEKSGVLKFSIRCIKRESESSPITYSFNTLPATVSISKALKANLEYNAEADNADELFVTAINNTQNTSSEEAANVSEPSFEAPGMNLNTKAYLLNDKVTLKAQAITSDAGMITYNWSYAATEPELAEEWTSEDRAGTTIFELITEKPDAARQASEVFYVKNNGEPVSYSVYTGNFEDEDMEKGIYERFAAYEILSSDRYVAGKYKVTAVNRVGFGSKSTESVECEIPAPKVLNIITDLIDYGAIVDTENGYVLPVAVEVDKDAQGDGVKVSYNWKKTLAKPDENGESVWDEVENTTNELAVKEPGWYKVEVVSTLNRANISKTSNIAKVTMPNAAPVLAHKAEDDMKVYDIDKLDSIELTIELATPYSSELESEELKYVWYTGDSSDPTPVVNGPEANGQGTKTLTVTNFGIPTLYWCKVSNKLGGVFSDEATSGEFFVR